MPSGQLKGERGGAMASWAAWSMVGCSLGCTISCPAFDLGQGLPASKWSQLLLQAMATSRKAGGGGLEGRGMWRREYSGASGNPEGIQKFDPT